MQTFRESTIPAERLRHHRKLPHVPGLAVGDIVYSEYGRRIGVYHSENLRLHGKPTPKPTPMMASRHQLHASRASVNPRLHARSVLPNADGETPARRAAKEAGS